MSPRLGRAPNALVELLRLCVVVFFAGVGYYVAQVLDDHGGPDPRARSAASASGSCSAPALGYVLGGVLGRGTITVVRRTEAGLRDTPAEHIVAGVVGTVIGVLVAVGITWPVFLLNRPILTIPVFAFVVVAMGLLGYRLGASKRDSVLGMFGARVGMAGQPVPDRRAAPHRRHLRRDRRPRSSTSSAPASCTGGCSCPSPVLGELQGLADAGDDLRRARGRRGLEVLAALRREPNVDVEILEDEVPGVPEVDAKLVRLCLDRNAALLTLDTNLAKVAALAGVRVMNLHALAQALRPPVTAGEEVSVLLIKPGKEHGQAVGYLDDGTMMVVERARDSVGKELTVVVTSVLTTANGRMVFAHPVGVTT